jgi:2-oxo-4-hydroxy-4-carboxy--5-ureidoimidazoline (OHCU) decarboxylase
LKAKLDDVNTPYKEKRRHPFATCVRTEREEKRAGAAREERPEGVNPPRI